MNAMSLSDNAKDQQVAGAESPMCAQRFGNSAASFCSLVFDLSVENKGVRSLCCGRQQLTKVSTAPTIALTAMHEPEMRAQ